MNHRLRKMDGIPSHVWQPLNLVTLACLLVVCCGSGSVAVAQNRFVPANVDQIKSKQSQVGSVETAAPTLRAQTSANWAKPAQTDSIRNVGSSSSADNILQISNEIRRICGTGPAHAHRIATDDSASQTNTDRFQGIDPRGSSPDIDSISNSIDALKNALINEQAAKARKQAAEQISDQVVNQDDVGTSQQPDSLTQSPGSTNTDRPPAAPSRSLTPNEAETPADSTAESNPGLSTGTQVVSSPVNSFELANSLFATGNYSQALRSYEALMQEDNSLHEQNWLRCLAASCYRIQGESMKAESLYREVVSSKEQSYASDYSRWFLEQLSRRKSIDEQFHALEANLGNDNQDVSK